MIEVYPNLLVGDEGGYLNYVGYIPPSLYRGIIHACKEPYHRMKLGYKTQGAPTDIGDDYYFIEKRDYLTGVYELTLNMIDANSMKYIPNILFEKALEFIDEHISDGRILLHCNRGESRSVGIAMVYLDRYTDFFEDCLSLEGQYTKFKTVYPRAKLGKGMYEAVKQLYSTSDKRKVQHA